MTLPSHVRRCGVGTDCHRPAAGLETANSACRPCLHKKKKKTTIEYLATNEAECHIHVRRTSTQNCTRVHNATSNIDLANWRA